MEKNPREVVLQAEFSALNQRVRDLEELVRTLQTNSASHGIDIDHINDEMNNIDASLDNHQGEIDDIVSEVELLNQKRLKVKVVAMEEDDE